MLRPLVLAALVSTLSSAVLSSAVLSSALLACGGTPEAEAPEAAPSAAPSASEAPPAASALAPAASVAPAVPSGATGESESKLRATKSLDPSETPFPEIEAVTKELGAPAASTKAARRQWRYGAKPLGKTFSCETVDLIRMPSGAVAFDTSVRTSPDCKKVKTTEAQVAAVLDTLGGTPDDAATPIELRAERAVGKKFDEVAALFEKQLGKPLESGEPELAAWRYVADDETCRLVIVTSHLGSGAGQAIWGVPCE